MIKKLLFAAVCFCSLSFMAQAQQALKFGTVNSQEIFMLMPEKATAEKTLQDIIISFKQNLRVINKSSNHIIKYIDGQKKRVPQAKGDSWSIRKSLHKDTVFGIVNLREVKRVSLSQAIKHPVGIVDKELKSFIKGLFKNKMDTGEIEAFFKKKNFICKVFL